MKYLIIFLVIIILVSGCAGSGFEKKTTLVPDSIGVSFGQSRYREEDAAYRGFTIDARWSFK